MGAQEEKGADRAQSLEEIFKICIETIALVVRSCGEDSSDTPESVDDEGHEYDEARDQHTCGVAVRSNRRLPCLRTLKYGEVVPDVEDGPHKKRRNSQE